MTRRRRLGLLLILLGAVALGLAQQRLPALTATLLERVLTGVFNRPVTIMEVRFHLVPPQLEVLGLRVGGITPGAPPFLEATRAVAVPALAPLRGRRVELSRLRLEGLRIRINAFEKRGDDIPKFGGGGGGGLDFRVRRLAIVDGEFELDHRRVPLTLDLPDFEGRLSQQTARALAGSVSFGPGQIRFGTKPELRVGTEIELRVEGSLVTVERARLIAENIDLAYTGQIRVSSSPQGRFELRGPVDLAVLDRHVMQTGLDIAGDARFDGTLTVDGSRLRLRGRMEGSRGRFDGVPVPRFAGEVAWDEKGVHLRELALEALGGSGTLQVDVPPGSSIAQLQAAIREVDAEPTLRWIFDLGAFDIGASATGSVDLRWPRGRFRELSGRIAVDLTERPDGRTPLSGRLDWSAEQGAQTIERADLRTPTTSARLRGRIALDRRTDLALEADSREVADADRILLRLRRALGAPEAQLAGFSGHGSFKGRWTGTLQMPVFDGRFIGGDIGYLGVTWGRADWVGTATPFEVDCRPLVVERGPASLRILGRLETGYYGERDALETTARLVAWPAQDLVKALGWEVRVSGPVSGEVRVAGRRSNPSGTARLQLPEGLYYGVPFEALEAASSFKEGVTEVSSGRARVGGGALAFRGSLTDDGFYDGSATARDVEIAGLMTGAAATRPAGRVSGEMTLLGPLDRPRVVASLRSTRLFLGDEGIGALAGTARGSGDGSVALDASCASPRLDVRLSGSVRMDRSLAARLRLTARDTSLDPFLRALLPALPPALAVVASGDVEIDGPLLEPPALRASVSVPSLQVLFPDYPVRNRRPLRLRLENGTLRVEDLTLSGDGTDLAVTGSAAVFGEGALGIGVRGAADLRALSVLFRRLRGFGAARLSMDLRGTRKEPRLQGALDLQGASLRVRGFPHGIEDLHGSVRFDERTATLQGVAGSVGGGVVDLEGQIAYPGAQLTGIDVHASGRTLALRYPEGLRSVVDADLRLLGDATRQWLSGTVDVRQSVYTRRYDVASELLAASVARSEAVPQEEGLRYDIRVRAPGTLQIDNNLASLKARADLSLQGSVEAPVVLGRAEVERGRVYFQGNTYTIRSGVIDFANPRRMDPQFDIEAETRIRSYRVTLRVNGSLERVYPTLTSDPPLSAVQIVNLLAGADESAVQSLTQSQADQAKMAAAGAATLAAGRLSEEVGLERQAERLFGLNRFSIDPSLVRGNVTNPTARLTVGKRLTPDLNVLYSVDLRGTEERLLSVEYSLSDRVSILLTQSNPGGYGFDLRIRQSH
jgi:translocation and assembly module TamB